MTAIRRLCAGGALGLLPALFCITGFVTLRLTENACASNVYTEKWGYASLAIYIAAPAFVVWGVSCAAFAVDGLRELLRGGLIGALTGGAILFTWFIGMSTRGCPQWDYLERLLLYSALLIMLLATPIGAVLGWRLSDIGARNLRFRTLFDSKMRKCAYCGAMPGIAGLIWSTAIFALYLIGDDYYGTASYAFLLMLLSASAAVAGGQVGWLIGWLRSRRGLGIL